MGLDQYWMQKSEDGDSEFHYHRKVPALEAFMANEWLNSDAYYECDEDEEPDVFNCKKLTVTQAMLDLLQEKVSNKSLNHDASGFFFGSHHDEDYEDIQEAINKAQDLLKTGAEIYYTSWW